MKQLKIVADIFVMHLLDYAFYMHWRKFEVLWFSLASKLGFHPLTKAVLVAISTSPSKWPPIAPY
jgi:hypothetical protein